ncbi:MAG TPA: GAF domain-containing protein [Bryobacteraceae bacterium]|nr:GAF domain-containing protein [Bryobacteraceae bacterium]
MKRWTLPTLMLLVALGGWLAPAQVRLTLEQVGSRQAPQYTPTYAGQRVTVQGVVSSKAFHFPAYVLLAFEESGHGAVLEVSAGSEDLDIYLPGDDIEAEGTISSYAGLVTIRPSNIRKVGQKPPPAPQRISVEELQGFGHLGQLVRSEGRIVELGETTSGPYLLVSSSAGDYKFFLPHGPDASPRSLTGLRTGDRVEATGVAAQYCTTAPYNRWFELLVGDPSQLIVTERRTTVPPLALAAGLMVVMVIGFVLWSRERRIRGQRERLRKTYQLGEEILGAPSVEAILAAIGEALPRVLGVSGVHMYVYNRGGKTLDEVVSEGHSPLSISLSAPPGGTQSGAVACFHYRTLLAIPDIQRSPFPIAPTAGQGAPKSLLFVPMLSQGEVAGVVELDQDDRARDFTPDEQALAQHLANQIGVAIRLLDQRFVQEQLFRTEKLAAVGRLISGVVNELQTPLASISELADQALMRSPASAADREMQAIAAEAQKASAIVSRLVSFAAAEQGDARPINVTALLRNLIEFRERDWKASGIRVEDLTLPEALFVTGSHGQLEQAFLTLFVHAEQSLAQAPEKTITIRASILAKRLLVEIAFSAPPDSRTPDETAAVLGVTRGVIGGHGGEVRLVEKDNGHPRFEVDLPLTRERAIPAQEATSSRNGGRQMTALVIEPDDASQRQLLSLLANHGYRVVPVGNADAGLELAQRMRFDAAFCSVHAPGLNWVELSERLQSRVGGFVLLSDHHDPELSADFDGDGRFVVAKPVQESDLERVLRSLDSLVESQNPS